jgi:hypothetical protein
MRLNMLNKIGAATRATLSYFAKLPMDLVNTVLDRTWFTVALFLVIVLPFSAGAVYDRIHNYVSATVRISKVEHICYIDKGRRPGDPPSPTAPCEVLQQEAERDGILEDLRIHQDTYISFNYTSPVDGEVHEGRLRRSPNMEEPEVNQEIRILISRFHPTEVKN